MASYHIKTKMKRGRRRLLKTILSIISLPLATSSLKALANTSNNETNTLSQHEKDTLVRVSRLLFPHKGLSANIYRKILQKPAGKNNSAQLLILKSGVKKLDKNNSKWLSLTEDQQILLLQEIENTPFFQLIRKLSIETLYRDPQVWKIIHYEGSAIEHGGYIDNGFNDIDWLPES